MARTIDLSRGYKVLSKEDKLYLAQRGQLPKDHIDEGLADLLDSSKPLSNVAVGAHTGTVRNIPDHVLEAELERRRAEAADQPGAEDPRDLMPDLDNPNSEKAKEQETLAKKFADEGDAKHAAAQHANRGPAHPTLGAPGVTGAELAARSRLEVSTEEDALEPPYDREGVTKAMLEAEIVRRNEGRDDEDKIDIMGNKGDLVGRLDQDDQDYSDEDDEED